MMMDSSNIAGAMSHGSLESGLALYCQKEKGNVG